MDIKELAINIAEANRDSITAFINEYEKHRTSTLVMAYYLDEAFHNIIWEIENNINQ